MIIVVSFIVGSFIGWVLAKKYNEYLWNKACGGVHHMRGCGRERRGCVPGCDNYDPKYDG